MNNARHTPLHILFLDFDDIRNPLLNAGQARATYEVGRRLALKGHTVTVLSSRYPGCKDRVEDGITYKHIGIGTSHIRFNNLVYILTYGFSLMRMKADIVVECFTAPISTLMSPLWTRIPVVAMPTSYEAERFARLYKLPVDKIEWFGSRFYKYFMPYTPYLEAKMKKVNPHIITRIIPEGVGDEYFEIPKKKPRYILYLGRFDMGQKGLDILLRAYAKVAHELPYPLALAGHGPDAARIEALIQQLNLADKVMVLGSTYGEEKMRVLSEALFVAFPSRHEGFPLFGLEALASGLPLVGFDIPGLSWADNSVASKAKPFDIDMYADLLKQMATREDIQECSSKARAFAKQFTWDKVAAQFEDFFREILQIEQHT